MSIVQKVGPNSWTCQTCGRDIVGKAKADAHAATCKPKGGAK